MVNHIVQTDNEEPYSIYGVQKAGMVSSKSQTSNIVKYNSVASTSRALELLKKLQAQTI